jgi:aconitate hydratase
MSGFNVTQKLINDHLVSGEMQVGCEIGIRIDQTLTQDATGTMVMLELEAMGLKRAKTEVSVQYVDHNLLQTDFKNPDDHLFLQSACNKFGLWYSPPGNGVSHPVHMERFGIPGKTLLGSDSHTPAAGSLGMLAIGAGGLEVALAIAGEPFYLQMPQVMGVYLTGELSPWVSAKDVILEMLRRHGVAGGVGKIIEYYGPGLKNLTAMDRHVITNMGAELGATTSVFPADKEVKEFLKRQGREKDFEELVADDDAEYDENDEIDLSTIEPLIACPSSPGNVVPVKEVSGRPIFQSMIGSSANPGMRDFVLPALIVKGQSIHPRVSLDINPSSRQILENLVEEGHLNDLIRSGARIHQPGCNGCIGMGQAPATDKISLRTNPRNFPGRSGTKDDLVYLCSPETAIASAITGEITDPRTLDQKYPKYKLKSSIIINKYMVHPPAVEGEVDELIKGPNIKSLPEFLPIQDSIEGPVLLKMENNVSTDEILPAGTKVLPFRSNIPKIAEFTFGQIDETFFTRASEARDDSSNTGSFLIGGANYGQGSSREHAAITPNYLGVKVVIAKTYARIHRKNLINFGILPLVFNQESDHKNIDQDDTLSCSKILEDLKQDTPIKIENKTKNNSFEVNCPLSDHEKEILLAGGLINYLKQKHA